MITQYFTYVLYSFLRSFAKNGLLQSTDRVMHAFVRCFEGRVYRIFFIWMGMFHSQCFIR
ncbi:hypothetical protein E2C01_019936 [Portunus trituberculatus]|uniref:Uncharacterized protein n=1 Tax=Portunus trituberculatus TaxID=210409 RepID=A0A5B7E0R7_PORTR|nr:hypothetical protein [Portunus trituberculatus]